jgi:voltage-gated potassium channel
VEVPVSNGQPAQAEATAYEFFMLCLCVWALLSLAAVTFLELPDTVASILTYADYAICGVFFYDFLRSLYRAPKRLVYMVTWGWIDLLSSIPAIGPLRWGRAARLVRIFRLLRGLRSARVIFQFLVTKRAESALMVAILLTLLVVVSASIAILQIEPAAGGNIKNAEDAMWWAIATITTVGYGDVYPVTQAGRLVAIGLMMAGVGLFGALSGLVASWFLRGTRLSAVEMAEIRELLVELNNRQTQVSP